MQNIEKKYTYLQSEFPDQYQHSVRPNILETISEEYSQEKGSITNRSETHSNLNRMQKIHSQQQIGQKYSHRENKAYHQDKQYKAQNTKKGRNGSEEPDQQDTKIPYSEDRARTKSNYFIQTTNPDVFGHPSAAFAKKTCLECRSYAHKISELQNTYELLLHAKNEELDECRRVIDGLEDRIKIIERKNQQELQKNKKFRSQIQKKHTEDFLLKERQSEIIEYLKNRQIVLLEQLKDFQNEAYAKQIRAKSKTLKSESECGKNPYKSNKASDNQLRLTFKQKQGQRTGPIYHSPGNSLSGYSAKTYEQQFQSNETQRNFSANYTKDQNPSSPIFQTKEHLQSRNSELIERVPLRQIIKKQNEIQTLKDDLMVSELKIKIQKTKKLENTLFVK